MKNFSSGTPSKKAPGAVRSQAPPPSQPERSFERAELTSLNAAASVKRDDPRVTNILRMYTGADIALSIQRGLQNNHTVQALVDQAFKLGENKDPNHRDTESALAVLAINCGVTVSTLGSMDPLSGQASSVVRICIHFQTIENLNTVSN
jgi:hypothetical protein